jgi:hypothetical protein
VLTDRHDNLYTYLVKPSLIISIHQQYHPPFIFSILRHPPPSVQSPFCISHSSIPALHSFTQCSAKRNGRQQMRIRHAIHFSCELLVTEFYLSKSKCQSVAVPNAVQRRARGVAKLLSSRSRCRQHSLPLQTLTIPLHHPPHQLFLIPLLQRLLQHPLLQTTCSHSCSAKPKKTVAKAWTDFVISECGPNPFSRSSQ